MRRSQSIILPHSVSFPPFSCPHPFIEPCDDWWFVYHTYINVFFCLQTKQPATEATTLNCPFDAIACVCSNIWYKWGFEHESRMLYIVYYSSVRRKINRHIWHCGAMRIVMWCVLWLIVGCTGWMRTKKDCPSIL